MTIPFDKCVTKIVTFDLLLIVGHNFLIVRDWAFMFGICVPYVLSDGNINFEHVVLTVNFYLLL